MLVLSFWQGHALLLVSLEFNNLLTNGLERRTTEIPSFFPPMSVIGLILKPENLNLKEVDASVRLLL